MKETKCEVVRRELEELRLGDDSSSGATQHLRECDDCREFHRQQTKLRQIVGSLGTVQAPPDFDVRLRARLANEPSSGGFHLRMMQWSFATKGFAAAALILLFIGGVVYVKTFFNQSVKTNVAEQRNQPVQPAPKPVENKAVVQDQAPVVVALDNAPRRINKGERRGTSRTKPSLVAADFGSERPPVISNFERQSPIFPIDASLELLKFSFDDGHGNARTISVPSITFGSQRVLSGTNPFTQKRVGVW